MNLNIDDEKIKILILNYQQAQTPQERNAAYNKLHPFLHKVINLYIYNIRAEERPDARQNIHLAILTRLDTIKPLSILSIKDYFFIMCKRLVLNELDKIDVQDKRKELNHCAKELLQDVFILDEEDIQL